MTSMRARCKACILSLLLPLALQGQDVGLLRLNPATGATGKAGVYGGYEAGGYHPAFAPASLWKAGASAQGTRHGESTSFTGSFSFEQIDGKEQLTSMFLEPGYFPVDVLEFTPGDKTRQTFKLGGGFATEFTEEFVFGVKANYTAANYAKRKDRLSPSSATMASEYPPPTSSANGRKRLMPNRLAPRRTSPISPSWTRACVTALTRSGTATASTWTRRA